MDNNNVDQDIKIEEYKKFVEIAFANTLERPPKQEEKDIFLQGLISGGVSPSIEGIESLLKRSDDYKKGGFEQKKSDLKYNRAIQEQKESLMKKAMREKFGELNKEEQERLIRENQIKQQTLLQGEVKDKIVMMSSWNISCGIATYTKYLLNGLKSISSELKSKSELSAESLSIESDSKDIHKNRYSEWFSSRRELITKDNILLKDNVEQFDPNMAVNERSELTDGCDLSHIFIPFPVNDYNSFHEFSNQPNNKIKSKLVHIQHEFGIMPQPPNIDKDVPVIITWHSVNKDINNRMIEFDKKLNVVKHIIHQKSALDFIGENNLKKLEVIPHGARVIPQIKKEDAQSFLNLDIDFDSINKLNKPIGIVFGFQSANKNFKRLIDVAKKCNIHLIVPGATHRCGYKDGVLMYNSGYDNINSNNITFLDRYLQEAEVDLLALSSDLLLYDFKLQEEYSCSGSMYRIISAGKPVVAIDSRHFAEVDENNGVLKFKDNEDSLQEKIIEALDRKEELGKAARNYAEKVSWRNIAKEHINIYRKYVDIEKLKEK